MATSKPFRMPPLNALRTFESAGRLASIKGAAHELHVTPGAVSRQITLLEETLGIRLFERLNRSLRLTPAAAVYHARLSDGFRQVREATEQLLEGHRVRSLHIRATTTFAMRWMLPRLRSFHEANPHADVTVSTSLQPIDFDMTPDVDVAIRLGTGDWPRSSSHLLFQTRLMPVCSPDLLKRMPLAELGDLRHHVLLHSRARPEDWRSWIEVQEPADIDAGQGMHFDSSALAYQAAIAGIGVAMGQLALIEEDLQQGRLVAPLGRPTVASTAFYLIYPHRLAQHPDLVRFCNWIMDEAGRHEESMAR